MVEQQSGSRKRKSRNRRNNRDSQRTGDRYSDILLPNKEVSVSCAVTVGGSDPEPQQKLLKKITVKTVDEDGESITTTKLTYDDMNRVSGSTTENFDGPGTSTTSTYTMKPAR